MIPKSRYPLVDDKHETSTRNAETRENTCTSPTETHQKMSVIAKIFFIEKDY